MGMQIFLQGCNFILFEYRPRSGIAGSYSSFILNILRNLHTDFHNGYTNVDSYWQYTRIPFSPHPCQHLLSLDFGDGIPTGMKWYLTVVFICSSLMISDVEYLFIYVLAISMSFFEKCLFRPFAHLKNWIINLFIFAIEFYEFFIYLGY